MIKESIRRLLNREKGAVLLLSRRGELLFTNTLAHKYFNRLNNSANSVYPLLSPDTRIYLRKLISQKKPSNSAVQTFCGIVEVKHTQLPTRFWLKPTSTSQEDIFILLLESIKDRNLISEPAHFYKAIADSSSNIVSVYTANFDCLYVNRNAHRQLGYPLVEYYANSGFVQFIDLAYRPAILSQLEKDTQNGVQFSKYYYLARKKNGDSIKITNFITRIFGEDDQLYQIVANEQISLLETNISTPTNTQEEFILANAHYLIYYVSQRTQQSLNISSDEATSLFSIIHPDDHVKLLADPGGQNDRDGAGSVQLRINYPHSGPRAVNATINRFFDAYNRMVCVAVRWKETSWIKEEDGLPAADLQHARSTDPTADLHGISFLLQQDLTIRYTSPAAEEVLGYTSSELHGQNIIELVDENVQVSIKEQLVSAFSQSVPNLVCLLKKKDSTYQPFDITLKIISEGSEPPALLITLHAMSFTDPKLFQLVIDHLPDAVFLLKYSDLSVVEVNSSALTLLQQDRSQLIGTEFLSLWDSQIQDQLRGFMGNETEPATQDIQYTTRQGHSFWGNTTVKPMMSGSKSQENIIVLRIVDITERKQQELELQRHSSQESINARKDFLSQIGHEIRTPLNAVLGMTHLMLQSNPREDQKKMLQTLKFSGDNLTALINDILDLSKIEAGQLRLDHNEFNLLEFIQGIKLTYRSLVSDRGILFRLLIEDEVPNFVMGDVNRLGQILNNLLSNAVKFTEEGQIVLSVYVEEEEEEQYVLLFEVSDTGIGIAEDKLSIIFKPYQQAGPRKYGGTGLGLSIVKSIVELQNGTITVQSAEQKGSTFRVALPFGKSSHSETARSESSYSFISEFQSLKGLKVLYVEDVIPNQLLMEGLSDKWDIELDTALNGLEALQKVKDNQYDLILMDIQMPEMDGYEATREIRNLKDTHYENIPIIALTASVSDKTRERIQEIGMNDYIPKPINPKSLHQKLAELAKNRTPDHLAIAPVDYKVDSSFNPDFSQLRELYLDDPKGYIEILEQIQRLTLECFPVIINAINRREEETLRFNCHKIMSYVRLLRLSTLEARLNEAKEQVSSSESSGHSDAIVQQLTRDFDKLEQSISNEITIHS